MALITKELIFGFQILDLKDHFSASLNASCQNMLANDLRMRTKESIIFSTGGSWNWIEIHKSGLFPPTNVSKISFPPPLRLHSKFL